MVFGKSTLLQLIQGTLSPTMGVIQGAQALKITFVEQELAHFDKLEVSAREADLPLSGRYLMCHLQR